jgi:hypothetical protein
MAKFFVTPTRVLDSDIITDIEYVPKGTPTGDRTLTQEGIVPSLSEASSLRIRTDRDEISLKGEAADRAWKLYMETTEGLPGDPDPHRGLTIER